MVMDPCMPNGFSTNDGQTQNPYGPFETFGSSSGSAVSVAANLVTVSVGSETQGSIIEPAGINSVVGLKTSRGLVSGDYIIPLLRWQDVSGPIGRTVTGVAVLLGAMTGIDANDPNTQNSSDLVGIDFTTKLETEVIVGIPVWTEDSVRDQFAKKNLTLTDEQVTEVFESFAGENEKARAVGDTLSSSGTMITVKEVPPNLIPSGISFGPAVEYGFREALDEFLTGLGDYAPFTSLSEIVDYNNQDLTNRAPYGQGYLEGSVNTTITKEEYTEIRDTNLALAREELDTLFESQGIDVIFSLVSQTYAPAGYPALTVPSGYDPQGKPERVVFVGGFMSEPQLLSVGYAYEQATLARVAPDLEAEPWLLKPCTPCAQVEPYCYVPDTCALRDLTTGIWTGEAAPCNEVAPLCEECFSDSPCYFNNNTSSNSTDGDTSNNGSESSNGDKEQDGSTISGGTNILSVWGLLVAGWMALVVMHANFI